MKIVIRIGEISMDSVNMFIFDIEKDGWFGFVIVIGKVEVGRVYVYVENGILLDIIENEGMVYFVS